jgi:hypothetical protein
LKEKEMKKQITIMMAIAVFTAVIQASVPAFAQGSNPASVSPPFLAGIEITEGRFDPLNGAVTGNAFALDGHGEWEHIHLSVSVDYFTARGSGPSALDLVYGGSFSLVVYDIERNYLGTVVGTIQAGEITWVKEPNGNPLRQTSADLVQTGGLGMYGPDRKRKGWEPMIVHLIIYSNPETKETTGFLTAVN